MFSIGETVLCNCGVGGIPVGTQGIINGGPTAVFGKTLYSVKCPGFASRLQDENCLSSISSRDALPRFFNIGDTITLVKPRELIGIGTLGIVASEPMRRFGKVFYDVFFDGQVTHLMVQEDSLGGGSSSP